MSGELIEWESDDEGSTIEWEQESPAPQTKGQAASLSTQPKKKGIFGNMFDAIKSDLKLRMAYDSSKLYYDKPFIKQKKNFRFDGDMRIDANCVLGPSEDINDDLKPMNIVGGGFEVGLRINDPKTTAALINSKLTVGRKLKVHGHLMGTGSIISGDTEVTGSIHIRDLSTVGNILATNIRVEKNLEAKVGSISAKRSIHSDGEIHAGHTIEVHNGDIYCQGLCDAIEIRAPHGNIDVGKFALYNAVKGGKFYAQRPKIRKLIAGSKWDPKQIRIEDENCFNAVMNAYNMGELKVKGEIVKTGK